MSTEHREPVSRKVGHELRELAGIFLFLAVFLGAFAVYRALLLQEFHLGYFRLATVIINALVLAKIVMIGEYAGLGRGQEHRRLIVVAIYKAFLFGLLAVAFELAEDAIKAWIHHERLAVEFSRLHTAAGKYELLARCLVLFCAFVPFFALREAQRVVGARRLYELFFGTGPKSVSTP